MLQKLIVHNLIPKYGSQNHVTKEDAMCIYCIMGGIKLQWSQIMLEAMLRPIHSKLYFPCVITRILLHNGIILDESCSSTVDQNCDDTLVRNMFGRYLNREDVDPDSEEEDPEKKSPPAAIPKKHKVCVSRPSTPSSPKAVETTAFQLQALRTQLSDLATAMTSLSTRVDEGFEGMQMHFSSREELDRRTLLKISEIEETQALIFSKLDMSGPYASSSHARPPY